MQADLVGIIESIYRVEDEAESWLRGILERLAPWLDDGTGLFGYLYQVSPEGRLSTDSFTAVGCAQEQLRELPDAVKRQEASFYREAMSNDFARASDLPGWASSGGRTRAVSDGVEDVWMVLGRNHDARGCGVFVNRRRSVTPGKAQTSLFVRIATHLAAAHRLRERLDTSTASSRAEAILAPDGRVHHATGVAGSRASLDALTTAARLRERVRGRLRDVDPLRGVSTWKGLVAARWTLVDHFESDGRRYVLAQENEPVPQPLATLSTRERQVVANAALGRSNKEIAYALGLAHSTVRVLLARAAKKLGASSRAQLVERFAVLGRDIGAVAD